ncbi:MAG: hypothetical protein EZS28_029715 [Streblomastix strix]|uniref:Uncharacterized protein n=1 Tax=Streblomastix strix TaxID=222440 RepID=A0A5J4UWT9_9EUKA|nr:MAG: hypothetical protein EZS28_029715 [Streblomastix strix]
MEFIKPSCWVDESFYRQFIVEGDFSLLTVLTSALMQLVELNEQTKIGGILCKGELKPTKKGQIKTKNEVIYSSYPRLFQRIVFCKPPDAESARSSVAQFFAFRCNFSHEIFIDCKFEIPFERFEVESVYNIRGD